MALSGSVSTNKYSTSSHGTIGLILSWTASQSIVNNQTTINWTLKSNGTMSSGYSVQAGPVTVKIGGTTVLNTTSRFSMYGGGGYSKSGTIKVTHNEDGSKSVSMSVRAAIYSASVNCTGSKTFSLNKITRYALLGTVSDFTDEVGNDGYPSITYSNPAGTDLVTGLKIRITWDNENDYTSWHSLDDGGADSPYTFDSSTLTSGDIDRMLQFCTTSNTLPVKFDLQSTLGGVEYHNYKDAVMTIVNADPIAGAVSFSDVDPSVVLITGGVEMVQLQSTIRIETATSTPQKYASIVSYSLNINEKDYDITDDLYHDFVKPNYTGTFLATVTTTDSRGNTATGTASITVTPWQAPSATYTAERVNGFETNTTLTVDGTISTVTGSSMVIQERTSDDGGQTWSGYTGIADNTPTTIVLDNRYDWLIQVTVSDAFATTTYTITVGKGIPNIAIGKNWSCLGINGYPEKDGQLFIGDDGEAKVNGVVFPMVKQSAEHKVGYWIDGTTIVYERTIELNSTVTASAGNTSAAGSWTTLQSGWNEAILPIEFFAWSNGTDKTLSTHLTVQWQSSGKCLRVLNIRSVTTSIDGFTIRYIKM